MELHGKEKLLVILFIITTLLLTASGVPTLSADITPSNYGTTETLICTDITYTYKNSYLWEKDGVSIFNNYGEYSTTGKYSETIDGTTFKLVINDINVSDEGTYTCNHRFTTSNSLNLEVESRGNVTATLSSSNLLEVTFQQIYPDTISAVITCDSNNLSGSFKTPESDGDRFTITWESENNFKSVPLSCSATVTLRTTFNHTFQVTSSKSASTPDCCFWWKNCIKWKKGLCVYLFLLFVLYMILTFVITTGIAVEAKFHIWDDMDKKKRIVSFCAFLFGFGLFLCNMIRQKCSGVRYVPIINEGWPHRASTGGAVCVTKVLPGGPAVSDLISHRLGKTARLRRSYE